MNVFITDLFVYIRVIKVFVSIKRRSIIECTKTKKSFSTTVKDLFVNIIQKYDGESTGGTKTQGNWELIGKDTFNRNRYTKGYI